MKESTATASSTTPRTSYHRPTRSIGNAARTPLTSPLTRKLTNTGSHRLYKAPQASIRGGDSHEILWTRKQEDTLVGSTAAVGRTRRRRPSNTVHHNGAPTENTGTGFSLERQMSNSSIGVPEAPTLWQETDSDLHSSFPDLKPVQSPPVRPRRAVRSLHVHRGSEDFSDHLDDESFAGTYFSKSERSHEDRPLVARANAVRRVTVTPWMVAQIVLVLVMVGFVYDSHHKVKAHKIKLKEYDEERAHILEQMMWIDKAAKKVHEKYGPADIMTETKEELAAEAKALKDELEELQVRIQLNARDRINESFGDKPLHINLKMADGGELRDIVLALSDDTPHAAATLLTQIEKKLWEDMEFTQIEEGVVQVSSHSPTSTPLLEFVERSRGCHVAGSVALHPMVTDEISILTLRIHLVDNAPLHARDVCIGKVVDGLEYLHNLQG